MSIYWKVHKIVWTKHFNKYKKKRPEILYDRLFKQWTCTTNPLEAAIDIEYVAEECCGVGLYYPFLVDGEPMHHHSFGQVLNDAYNCDGVFGIDDSMKECYSRQELDMLKAIVNQSASDKGINKKHVDNL